VARELVLFHHLPLDNIPAAHWDNIIKQQIITLSPFAQTGHYYVLSKTTLASAQIWLWDEQLQQNRQAEYFKQAAQKPPKDLAALPETVFYPRQKNGYYQLACQQGYELQYWHHGVLLASLWLADQEMQNEQDWFVRQYLSHHSDPAIRIGLIELSKTLKYPWGKYPGIHLGQLMSRSLLSKMLLVLLLMWGASEGGYLLSLQQRQQQIQQQVEFINESLGELLSLRKKTIQLKIENESLLKLMQHTKLLSILREFDKQLPIKVLKPLQVDYQPGQLSLIVQDDQIDNRDYVEKLSASPLFSQVQLEPGLLADQLKISLQITIKQKDRK